MGRCFFFLLFYRKRFDVKCRQSLYPIEDDWIESVVSSRLLFFLLLLLLCLNDMPLDPNLPFNLLYEDEDEKHALHRAPLSVLNNKMRADTVHFAQLISSRLQCNVHTNHCNHKLPNQGIFFFLIFAPFFTEG